MDELKMIRLFATPFADNAASCRVLEKAGYVREGLMRKSAIKDGQLQNQVLYAFVD
jgi:[ribosomal protein S5]-alanine N-acetyltransferase